MLLARRGHRVLLTDRATFPSDTLSTHYVHQPGCARLAKWGLLDRVAATGCPPVREQVFDVGPFRLAGTPPPAGGVETGYAPRRTVLDDLLVRGATEAGAELRERFTVTDLVREGDRVVGVRATSPSGRSVEEKARVVVGADGARSTVARLVGAKSYDESPAASFAYYSYWSGADVKTAELYPRPGRMTITAPTNDGLALVIVYWPLSRWDEVRADVERKFLEAVDDLPALAPRIRAGKREEKFRGTADLDGFFRTSHGPGWALVGDAGYHKNPITAEGISDAFRDADRLAEAIDDGLAGRDEPDEALAAYARDRDRAVGPIYAMTCDLARLEPPPEDMQRLFGALRGNPVETGRFFGTIAGTVPIPEFFAPDNVRRILAAAGS
jgi:flavin-dependent dehydrogenase